MKGRVVVSLSPRVRVLRCSWEPLGCDGPLWHFEPTRPKQGIAGLWHAFLHEGKPKDMRKGRWQSH
jgi:hypothetical protein